jgi:triphosphoribosyl-dephospho-CoA synthase
MTRPPGALRERPSGDAFTATGAGDVARAALASLHEELVAHPKPGLVGPGDRGSHTDMDAATFLRSILSLRAFFRDAALAGAEGAPFEDLRTLGVAAERRMLRATGGANTHRGAIFSLGLLAAAAGGLRARGQSLAGEALGMSIRDRHGRAIRERLPPDPASHGTHAGRLHGAGGAREEAAAGFPHVFRVALPALAEARARGADRRAAAVHGLMTLVAGVVDTNLLHRGGAAGLFVARSMARDFLRRGGALRAGWEEQAQEVHREFVVRNLSPGGSADLLAAALFVERVRAIGDPAPR